ncbi:hypothetical protein PAXRUDRAFT_156596 [Paxillus rubicundulus Ve08.2h10]|uniref:Uncharacterized protein n=1 Tax=Paxillus rubicundulus Ve08.2h10 TaxID=930991 RepID=A0A0D0CEN7_9AGAM|nr:hypothetical protein PAXRUDRAFT_156596 [Paxillus rubicundulus Ve08.2h10]
MAGFALYAKPLVSTIWDKAQECFKKQAGLWQIKGEIMFLKGNRDIVCIADTSMGKILFCSFICSFCL